MASTYTPLGVELQATGENAGTWGTKTNTNLQIIEQISGGYTTQAVSDSGDTTLSVSDGSTGATLSHRVIEFTGSLTASRNVTIPLDVQNFYFLKNATSGSQNVVFKYATGTGTSATVANGKTVIAYAKADDGTNPNISTISLASDLVDDTTPQLGGNLDTNSFMIDFDDAHGLRDENGNEQLFFSTTSSAVNYLNVTNAATGNDPKLSALGDDSNIDLAISPKGTGEVVVGTGSAAATVTSSGAYDLRLDTNSGTNSSYINIVDAANGNVQLYPNGTGLTEIGGGTNAGTVQLNCESNSHGIKLQSPPHSASQSYTLIFPTGNVTADRFLKVASITGSGTTAVGQLSFAEVSGGTSWQAVKTSTFTAAAGEGYFVDTTSNVITMNLPAGTLGDEVVFIDYAGTFDSNTFTISANGSEKIHGSTNDLTVSTERAGNTLVYTDGTQGWLLKNN
jgi:hypothetical protein